MTKSIKIYTDGGARGNPGPAATGVVIFDKSDKLLKLDGKYLGTATNNQAEYEALIQALELVQRHGGVEKITCYLDSELIVKQLTGLYKIKNDKIKEFKEKLDSITQNLGKIEYIHLKREKNKLADKIVNIILDAVEKKN